jgi:hypothetical protein
VGRKREGRESGDRRMRGEADEGRWRIEGVDGGVGSIVIVDTSCATAMGENVRRQNSQGEGP